MYFYLLLQVLKKKTKQSLKPVFKLIIFVLKKS